MQTFPHTLLEPQDDPAFLGIVDRVVGGLVRRDWPDDVYLIVIDNWFDHKWLRYSGYGTIALPRGYLSLVVAKEEHREDQLTFPPFPPNRVVAQYLFCRVAERGYEEQSPAHLIHSQKRQRSSKNLHRRVVDFCQSGLFVWYSSASSSNRKGSLMVYSVGEGRIGTWYAAFTDRHGWHLDRVKSIDREVVASLMAGKLEEHLA